MLSCIFFNSALTPLQIAGFSLLKAGIPNNNNNNKKRQMCVPGVSEADSSVYNNWQLLCLTRIKCLGALLVHIQSEFCAIQLTFVVCMGGGEEWKKISAEFGFEVSFLTRPVDGSSVSFKDQMQRETEFLVLFPEAHGFLTFISLK